MITLLPVLTESQLPKVSFLRPAMLRYYYHTLLSLLEALQLKAVQLLISKTQCTTFLAFGRVSTTRILVPLDSHQLCHNGALFLLYHTVRTIRDTDEHLCHVMHFAHDLDCRQYIDVDRWMKHLWIIQLNIEISSKPTEVLIFWIWA